MNTTLVGHASSATHEGLKVVPVRHWGRRSLACIVPLVVLLLAYSFATNPNIDWSIVGEYLFNAAILDGLWGTLKLTGLSMVIGVVLAVIIAVMRISESKVVSWTAAGYVFIFRGVPLIVLLIFVGNLGLFFKELTIGIPMTDLNLISVEAKEIMTPFIASVIGLSLAGSGYMAEIVRAGLLSVGRGQHEAATALGCTPGLTLRHIVIPQAMKVLVPPLGNELIGMLKASAIVSVIAGGDLLTIALGISGINYRTIELLIVATIWYLTVISVLSVVQFFVERRVAAR